MSHGEQFLQQLAASDRDIAAAEVALMVAHPDDETVGCGGQLSRLRDSLLIVVTDGSPKDLADARREGLDSREEYAALRAVELSNALAACEARVELLMLGIMDQRASFHMIEIVWRLVPLLRRRAIRLLFTHAYEGGHPDHDATAFIAHQCARILRSLGHDIVVIEMPLYHCGCDGMVCQQFPAACEHPIMEIALSHRARSMKLRMLAAHHSQRCVLKLFDTTMERFRLAPSYRFEEVPNGGTLLYERYPWGMSGEVWRTLVRAAQDMLRPEEFAYRSLIQHERAAPPCR